MRPPLSLLALTLAANTALLGALVWRPSLAPPALRDYFTPAPSPEAIAAEARTRSLAAAQAQAAAAARAAESQGKLWAALVSNDVPTLIARLRAAGFPPSVARCIVEAHVRARVGAEFLARVAALPDAPYWKPNPMTGDPFGANVFWSAYGDYHRAVDKGLREALRDDWLAGSGGITPEQERLYGPLSRAQVALIERIDADYAEMAAQQRALTQGVSLAADRERYTLLERERLADLAAALTPEEFAEYRMRSSYVVMRSRNAFTLMNATEDEVRTVYRLEQALEDRLRAVRNDPGPAAQSLRDRTSPEYDQLERDLRAALGDARYADYRRSGNNEFQTLNEVVQRENLSADLATRAFDLRDTFARDAARIADDPTQTADQKRAALRTLAQATRAQLAATLGSAAMTAYQPYADHWLTPVERGQVVKFNSSGDPSFQSLPANPSP